MNGLRKQSPVEESERLGLLVSLPVVIVVHGFLESGAESSVVYKRAVLQIFRNHYPPLNEVGRQIS